MISINFASRNYRRVGRIRTGLLSGCIIFAVMAAGLLGNIVVLRADCTSMALTLRELEAADEQARTVLLVRERLVKDLNTMSALTESKKISWTRLLTSIEVVVPKGVALTMVDFSPKDSVLALSGMARSPEALRNLVVAMEKAEPFKDPFLKHQSLEKGSISFNVVAFYRKDTRAAVAQGKR